MVIDDETRHPLEGATISWMKIVGLEKSQRYGETVVETTTDKNGSFTLKCAIKPRVRDYNPTHVTQVKCPGYESIIYMGKSIGSPDPPVFSLSKGYRVTGKVVATNGDPIENALVGDLFLNSTGRSQNSKTEYITHPSGWVFTDHHGSFEIDGIRQDGQSVLRVVADGYLPAYSNQIDPTQDNNLSITLEQGGVSLHGTVVDHKGTPLANREVSVTQYAPPNTTDETINFFFYIRQSLTTDSEGNFTLENLYPGILQVDINWLEKTTLKYQEPERFEIDLTENDEIHQVFRFLPPIEASGKVINAKTNEGISGIRLTSQLSPETRTDIDGSFSMSLFTRKNKGPSRIYYDLPKEYRTGSNKIGSYDLTPDNKVVDYSNIVINLYPSENLYPSKNLALRFKVKVVDENGRRPNIEKVFINEIGKARSHTILPPLDHEGKFTEHLLPETPYFIWYEYALWSIKDTSPNYLATHTFSADKLEDTVTFETVYSIRGYIFDKNDTPVPNLHLELTPHFTEGPLLQKMWNARHRYKHVITNEDGKFIFHHYFPGKATLTNLSSRQKIQLDQEITVKKGELTDIGEIVCENIELSKPQETDKIKEKYIQLNINFPNTEIICMHKIQCYDGKTLLKTKIDHNYEETTIKGLNDVKNPIRVVISGDFYETVTLENVTVGDDKVIDVNLEIIPGYSVKVTIE
jgi:protocatechuate 3,4-dioxygenase beta subunit